jgi:hypothetical protein
VRTKVKNFLVVSFLKRLPIFVGSYILIGGVLSKGTFNKEVFENWWVALIPMLGFGFLSPYINIFHRKKHLKW